MMGSDAKVVVQHDRIALIGIAALYFFGERRKWDRLGSPNMPSREFMRLTHIDNARRCRTGLGLA